MTAASIAVPDVAEITPDGDLSFAQFHQGQRLAYHSKARFTLVLAGTQAGKTATGPPWLLRQIKEHGPGDYMVAAPNFTLMEKKALPEFLRLFQDCLHLGDYKAQVRKFVLSQDGMRRLFGYASMVPTQVYFGYGENPDSLESATLKAIWIDEGGQKAFKRESWDAILRRLSIEEGPVLLTTTPYTLGWLSELVKNADELGVAVINFPSIANPKFPRTEWERAKRELPAWKFNMFYRGIFERPAGLVLDCWSDENVIPHMVIPAHWPRFLGLDFGGVNTAGLFIAKELNADHEPTGRYIGYREYHAGGKTAAQHARDLLAGEPMLPTAVGGSKSEGQWRDEFTASGLGVWPPVVTEIEVGINRMYAMIAADERGVRRFVVLDSLKGWIDQVQSYARELDERGEPTEKIEDPHAAHFMDAGRYILGFLAEGGDGSWVA
jgi:hypothetical protein